MMGAVTYPNSEVESYISEFFIPIQINVVEHPDIAEKHNAPWTPTILIHDADKKEHRRTEGYLDPRRMIEELSLARMKAAVDRSDFVTAKALAPEVLRTTSGDQAREPEALYWTAVAEYKSTHDAKALTGGWTRLLEQYPESEWAKRAEFIRKAG
ncbi:MAG TPA: hypothetical protein VGP72_19905 [Planctomycetota bacterium]|jgi:hypothetical protein